ncbi:ATPase [Salipaludibacillus keqinensis]|uniref:ATPase n=1 Tax=Salipaludibacillus keqinensis TaxID=2045207 RepID=A0A323TFY9_9BACI|nr:BadF/BadG/BcrA/BcrD ATPase family protein [Salipaludibacillus keqinensis]PYZ92804.1 ATPase [Salipaludibacillus keqinensis]
MEYVIGIDGGGTKTACLFSPLIEGLPNNESEALIVIGEASNPHVVGFDVMKTRLQQLIVHGMETFAIKPSEIIGVSCGLAGVGRPEEEQQVEKVLQRIFLKLDFSEDSLFTIHSDSYIALRGAIPPDATDGILVISGTGSNAIGLANGEDIYRSGGWGHILGDEGSGYQIGLKALNQITKSFDLRGQDTILSKLILDELALEHPKELISYMYGRQPEKSEIARLAKQVIKAASQGDVVAAEILQEAAEDLLEHVESLHKKSKRFNEHTPVMTTGSIFTYSKKVEEHFTRMIHEKKLGIVQMANRSPVYGAAMIAKESVTKRLKK